MRKDVYLMICVQESTHSLTSILSYPERGEGGNNRYRGNCSPKLIQDLLAFYKPNQICDYMCGSGTTKAAADKIGISSHLYDLHSGFDLMHCDIPERPEFIFLASALLEHHSVFGYDVFSLCSPAEIWF